MFMYCMNYQSARKLTHFKTYCASRLVYIALLQYKILEMCSWLSGFFFFGQQLEYAHFNTQYG